MTKATIIAALTLALMACGSDTGPVFGGGGSSTVGVGGAGGAGSASSSSGALLCTPGQSVACACPGGAQGAQACRDDGGGFEACDCGAGAGGSGSASSSATGGAQCIATHGCTKAPDNGACTGSTAKEGYPLAYVNCDSTPPCCRAEFATEGFEWFCCAD